MMVIAFWFVVYMSGSVALTFGRFNPPTIGHEKLLEATRRLNPENYLVFASPSCDGRRNPLHLEEKTSYLRKLFPKHAPCIVSDPSIRNIIDALIYAQKLGHTSVTIVVGGDRVNEFKSLTSRYNGSKYHFDTIEVVSAGEREDMPGVSATTARKCALVDDFNKFSSLLPFETPTEIKTGLFKALQRRMGLKTRHR